jgi:hypothetical protein
MVERTLLRLAATLVALGFLVYLVAMYFHGLIDGRVDNGNDGTARITRDTGGIDPFEPTPPVACPV